MQIGMKYIVIKKLGYSEEEIILFSSAVLHVAVGNLIFRCADIVSAGFITVGPDGEASCFGRSTSLALTSRGQADAYLFNRANAVAALLMESENPMNTKMNVW